MWGSRTQGGQEEAAGEFLWEAQSTEGDPRSATWVANTPAVKEKHLALLLSVQIGKNEWTTQTLLPTYILQQQCYDDYCVHQGGEGAPVLGCVSDCWPCWTLHLHHWTLGASVLVERMHFLSHQKLVQMCVEWKSTNKGFFVCSFDVLGLQYESL